MALVTVQRSPSPSSDLETAESTESCSDGRSQIRKSLSESYFTIKGAALILPHNERNKKSVKKTHGGELQSHLQAMLHLLRPEDKIKIAVRLEDTVSHYHRYLAVVSTQGKQDTEEAVVLGMGCRADGAEIGLVIPVWMGLSLQLSGDGGFSLCIDETVYPFNPVSVQAMWSAIQSVVKVINIAEDRKYIQDGLTHTWIGFYRSRVIAHDNARQCGWNDAEVETFVPSYYNQSSSDSNVENEENVKRTISLVLKEVMLSCDIDNATSIMLRNAVEGKMGMSLQPWKSYFDEETMRILGQMDESSEILDFLYLGNEWNACNLEELKAKGIGYILNVTKEIDNFFLGMFQYYTVRLYDNEHEDLLRHWDKTYKFISKAKNNNSKVLVHCQRGISRSASTVMAFLMKENRWSVEEAHQFVKKRRNIIRPNEGFTEQLHTYCGILTASNKRDIFRCISDPNMVEETEEACPMEAEVQGSFLGDSLFHLLSHNEEWGDLHLGTDVDADARSADSAERALPDLPSSLPTSAVTKSPARVSRSHSDVTRSHSSVSRSHSEVTRSPSDVTRSASGISGSTTDESRSPLGTRPLDLTDTDQLEKKGKTIDETSIFTHGGITSRTKSDSSWICLDSLAGESSTDNDKIEDVFQENKQLLQSDDSGVKTDTIPQSINMGGSILIGGATETDSSDYHETSTNAAEIALSSPSKTGFHTEGRRSAFTKISSNSSGKHYSQRRSKSFSVSKSSSAICETVQTQVIERSMSEIEIQPHAKEKEIVLPSQMQDRSDSSWMISCSKGFADSEKHKEVISEPVKPTHEESPKDLLLKDETAQMSVYQKEEIPLMPGKVQRTKLEIEERQRFICTNEDEEMNQCSDEQTTGAIPSECKPMATETTNKALSKTVPVNPDHERPIRVATDAMEVDVLPNVGLPQKDAIEPGLVMKQKQELESVITRDERSPSTMKNTKESCFDPQTLELIREIGSALLMSPQPIKSQEMETEEESHPSLVKHFITKLEKHKPGNENKPRALSQGCISFQAVDSQCIDMSDSPTKISIAAEWKVREEANGTSTNVHSNKINLPSPCCSSDDSSVVKDLVGCYENKSPGSLDLGHNNSQKPTEGRTLLKAATLECSSNIQAEEPLQTFEQLTEASGLSLQSRKSFFEKEFLSSHKSTSKSSLNKSKSAGDCLPGQDNLDNVRIQSGPKPFSKDGIATQGGKGWRPVRPKSAGFAQRNSFSESQAHTSVRLGEKLSDMTVAERLAEYDEPQGNSAIRQVSDEGRKVRRLHGKSHPLTKLSQKRVGGGPFHSSM